MKTLRNLVSLLLLALPATMLAQATEIWVSLPDNPNRETNGIYGFPATDPQAISPRKTAPELYFQKGLGYQYGTIYGMDYRQGFFSADRYMLYAVDTKTWTVTERDVDKKFALREAACGADGSVYALFEDYVIGALDYQNLTRSDIYKPSRNYVALGVSSIGELYGIDDSGNLIRISTTDGEETLVGKLNIEIYSYANATGEIDPVSNMFYLAAKTGWNGSYTIFAIDLSTAKGEAIGQLPTDFSYLGGMVIAGEATAAGTPAKATGLKATFEGTSLSGTLSFTAPTETFDHQPLEGEMGYTVVYGTDGQYQLTGTALAGADVQLPVTLTEGGNITFSVKFANAAGEGQTASITLWIGPDSPLAPANVQLTISAEGLAQLTWTAPTACVNGGYLGTLTYNVYRSISGEEVLVAEGISATSFSEQLEITTLKEYVYTVVASNEGTLSERTASNRVVAGDGFGVPFVEQFGEGNHLEYFSVINVNHDEDRWGELTWKLHKQMTYWGDGISYEEMWVETTGATDDWLITPPIQLLPGHAYILKFRMKTGDAKTPEKFEVRMGRTAAVGNMTTQLLGERTIANDEYQLFTREFTVSEAGSYCIGFHATPNTGTALYLDDLEVRQNASSAAPGLSTDLMAVADPTGELVATISFKAPTLTIGGDALESLTRIDVLRDEALVASIEAPAPGSQQQVTDRQAVNGYNVYTIIAYNDEGNGLRTELQPLYVGVDVPQAPVVTLLADRGNSIHFEWAESPVKGARGYVVRPEEVSYEVYATDATGQKADLIYEGPERTFDAEYQDTDVFDLVKWFVVARNTAGRSADGVVKTATGYPLTLPYRETFAMGAVKTSIWTEQSGMRSWHPSTEDAVSTDAGALLFVPYADGDRSNYNTQRLTFAGVRLPRLSFWYKLEGGMLQVKAWQPDGSETVLYHQQSAAATPAKWSRATVEVPLLKQQAYGIVKFEATGEAGKRMFIDDVLICDGAYTDDIDGIDDLDAPERSSSSIDHSVYDLQGRRVAMPAKGLYIKNGKKIIK